MLLPLLMVLLLVRVWLQAFAPFVQRGFLEFVYGGADVGAYCCQHVLVAAVHLTGSEATYNNIVFGSPQVTRRAPPCSGLVVIQHLICQGVQGKLVLGDGALCVSTYRWYCSWMQTALESFQEKHALMSTPCCGWRFALYPLPFSQRIRLVVVHRVTDVCRLYPLLLLQPVGSPKLSKRVTAELGNVTPYIIVPGPWSREDMEYHATSVASGLAQNAGHNCIAAEVRANSSSPAGLPYHHANCVYSALCNPCIPRLRIHFSCAGGVLPPVWRKPRRMCFATQTQRRSDSRPCCLSGSCC
jgi:hypothetical protein